MSENNSNKNKKRDLPSRAEKNRQENNEENNQGNNNQRKYIIIIGVLLVVFIILLVGIVSGNDSGSELDTDSATSSEVSSEESSNSSESSAESSSEESSSETTSENEDETTTSESESTSDEQANQAPVDDVEVGDSDLDGAEFSYSGDWDSVATDQSGEHVTDYSEGSPDRQAIKSASAAVTGLDPDTMIEQWVGNDGTSNGVYATVSNADASEQYRVHLKWIDGQGWQPQTVDVIQN